MSDQPERPGKFSSINDRNKGLGGATHPLLRMCMHPSCKRETFGNKRWCGRCFAKINQEAAAIVKAIKKRVAEYNAERRAQGLRHHTDRGRLD